MTNTIEALDYEIVKCKYEDGFEVWTPDTCGGIIGLGKTREEAVRNAIACMGLTVASLAELIA